MRSIPVFVATILVAQSSWAWSEGGHHLIAVMAFEQLRPDQQSAVLDILKAHPRITDDFQIGEKSGDLELYLIGRAAYWPDVARQQPQFNRYSWHYQLGPALVLGDVKGVPMNPGPAPTDGTLDTQEMHIAQALELCTKIYRDGSRPAADRAIALCWVGHLVGDSHQPCHSGSLYCPLYPEGDRGANSIPTVQSKNMHSLWDGLLGPRFDAGDIKRRSLEIRADADLWTAAKAAAKAEGGLDPMRWLAESAELARGHVYTPEVLQPIEAASPGTKIEPIKLSEDYLKAAGRVAQKRAAYAAHRLALILASGVR